MQLRIGGAEFVEENPVEIRKPFAVIEVMEGESEREAEFPLSVDIDLGHGINLEMRSATPTIIPLADRTWPDRWSHALVEATGVTGSPDVKAHSGIGK